MRKARPKRPRLLIEEWLPAQGIGVECMRERSTGQQPPDKRLHVWWARRPLTVSRAAVLGSLLPADFDRACFERLLGFYGPASLIVANARRLELTRNGSKRIPNPHGPRAFSNAVADRDIASAHSATSDLWGGQPLVLDPMAGGGSIPLEAARLGFSTVANEYNPVACSVLEATADYPFRLGGALAEKTRKWGKTWRERFNKRMEVFYRTSGVIPAWSFIFTRTVPCPDTGHPTPLVPDWSLLRPNGGVHVVAEPVVNKQKGTWTIRVREVGNRAGQLRQPPQPTYDNGDGISLFTEKPIPADYIKAMAQARPSKMGSALYAVATKATRKLEFRPAEPADLEALAAAEQELTRLRPRWEREGIIPVEEIPPGDKTGDPNAGGTDTPLGRGETHWADLFAPRQLLALGVLVEELRALRSDIIAAEGEEMDEAVVHLLALALDKFVNHNSNMSRWDPTRPKIASVFDQHDYSFKATFAEMAPCVSGGGLAWAIENAIEAYEDLATLPRAAEARPVKITLGDAANLLALEDRSVTAVVVDPPYSDNVQYCELADFFYVWLKRTQGHRRAEWFASYLCDKGREAVKNLTRHRPPGVGRPRRGQRSPEETATKAAAQETYQRLMTEVSGECHRVLRDDGALTVMFTHKKQEAWEALFQSLIATGFTITATWPVQTESQHSLHQAEKNAAQSTVVLVARKRAPGTERAYFDDSMRAEIREVARGTAQRLQREGLNPVDQLVGAFGPAMEVFSRYPEVRTDRGETVGVGEAIQAAADAVAEWRVEQLAQRGIEGIDAESRFVLLCWDVLQAAQFRFNEAMLLGRSVRMDVNRMKEAGLLVGTGDKVRLLPARERRRERAVYTEQEQTALFAGYGRRRRPSRKVHPNDEYFISAIDMCHALALRCLEARGEQAGIGAARGTALQQGWKADSACARLMEALVRAAPEGVRFPGKGKKKTAADEFPEFRAWRAMLKPLFGIEPPEWKEPVEAQAVLELQEQDEEDEPGGEGE